MKTFPRFAGNWWARWKVPHPKAIINTKAGTDAGLCVLVEMARIELASERFDHKPLQA